MYLFRKRWTNVTIQLLCFILLFQLCLPLPSFLLFSALLQSTSLVEGDSFWEAQVGWGPCCSLSSAMTSGNAQSQLKIKIVLDNNSNKKNQQSPLHVQHPEMVGKRPTDRSCLIVRHSRYLFCLAHQDWF